LRILTVIGTRPEAIKLAPVVATLRRRPRVESIVCLTGQHREMLDQVLPQLDLEAQLNLALVRPGQSLNATTAALLAGMDKVMASVRPDRVMVQGDTTTAMAAAMAAFNRGVPIAHVEAGLRTYDPARPWPEETNRRTIDGLSDLLFAPTARARANLLAENQPGRVLLTGNTGIDSLEAGSDRLDGDHGLRARIDQELPALSPDKRLILVTGHRRETLGEGLLSVCRALGRLSERDDVEILYALHLNPQVEGPVRRALGDRANIRLAPPQSYLVFIRLMQRAHFVISDSGGVQEEAPALGKPVLVTRTETERGEAVDVGAAQLVGTAADAIVAAARRLLDDQVHYRLRAQRRFPFGDGRAAARIVDALMGLEIEEFTSRGVDPTSPARASYGGRGAGSEAGLRTVAAVPRSAN
jgi:UDP-N-acetylglucosamine 2-epimerase (non-hydrolysing)